MIKLSFAALALAATSVANPAFAATGHPASCTVENRPATIMHADPPDFPAPAEAGGVTGTSVIRVDLSDAGTVVGAYVRKSSGNGALDQAAIKNVKSISFAPELRSCAPIAGSYAVEVEFTP